MQKALAERLSKQQIGSPGSSPKTKSGLSTPKQKAASMRNSRSSTDLIISNRPSSRHTHDTAGTSQATSQRVYNAEPISEELISPSLPHQRASVASEKGAESSIGEAMPDLVAAKNCAESASYQQPSPFALAANSTSLRVAKDFRNEALYGNDLSASRFEDESAPGLRTASSPELQHQRESAELNDESDSPMGSQVKLKLERLAEDEHVREAQDDLMLRSSSIQTHLSESSKTSNPLVLGREAFSQQESQAVVQNSEPLEGSASAPLPFEGKKEAGKISQHAEKAVAGLNSQKDGMANFGVSQFQMTEQRSCPDPKTQRLEAKLAALKRHRHNSKQLVSFLTAAAVGLTKI